MRAAFVPSMLALFILALATQSSAQGIPSVISTNSAPAPLKSTQPPILPPPTYTPAFTYTTPTAAWTTPTFPLLPCSETPCPALSNKRCIDPQGSVYGVLCNTRFGGTIITSAGKHRKLEKAKKDKRSYMGTLENCLGFCDMYSAKMCKGVDFEVGGWCHYYAVVAGRIESAGEVALVRLS